MSLRRDFLKKAAAFAGTGSFLALANKAIAKDVAEALVSLGERTPEMAMSDEDLWSRIQLAYTVDPNLINLNNGAVSPQPKVVQDAVDRLYHWSNETPSYYMWRIIDEGREPLREKLAALAGVSPETIVINRNATEGLETVIFGLELEKGDEITVCNFDYPAMKHAWKQREMRDKIKLNWVKLDLPVEDEDEIVKQYIAQFTPKTKVVHITHVINWTGQVLPVAKICAEANKRGIQTVVDGAHSFAHLDFKVNDLDCDYYATSLHKWLCAPFGTGMLYVRKERIKDLWPMYAAENPKDTDVRKLEHLGTRSIPSEMAIGNAIDFHNAIGGARKEARLKYLKDYWVDQVKSHPKISFNSPTNKDLCGALTHFSIEGKEGKQIDKKLFYKYRIHAIPIKYEHINGVRITPNVYTKLSDLDKLSRAVLEIADQD